MAGETTAPAQPAPATAQTADRVVSDPDKKLAGDWLKRIADAQKRFEATFKRFELNRKLLAGKVTEDSAKHIRANLHFANMAAMIPQVYAKDPEFAVSPTMGVVPAQAKLVQQFAQTAEIMLTKCLIKDAKLKKQAKKLLRATFTTSVGWWKLSWQEKRATDPLILNQIKDTQDNIDRVAMLKQQADDPAIGQDAELKLAQLQQALDGLETQQEVTIAKGLALDFVMSEDVIVLDASIRCVTDYPRAAAMAHRVWMTPDQYQSRFKYAAKKGKMYTEQAATGAITSNGSADKSASLLCVWEIWSQDDNRIYYVCDGEEGFCEEPKSPDWTGRQWYPFFGGAFNEIDGSFYPLSDIELTDKLVAEYNQSREDFVRDRKGALPVNVVRKGGSLTDEDIKKIANRQGSDVILVEGVGGKALSDDMFSGQLSKLDPNSYDTSQSQRDMEKILGGSDTTTGSITKAKTATEAEILSQGLRSRAAERQDIMEDVLNELGPYALEIMLRKYTLQEVQAIAGPDAVWPELSIDQIFNLVSVEVRGGSTGKPDRLQEQDRWLKLLPIIKEAVQTVAELREKGQDQLAQAVIELARETLHRFDERLDIEQFLPPAPKDENDPALLKQQNVTLKQQVQLLMDKLKDATTLVEKGYVSAAAQVASSANPAQSVIAFKAAMGEIDPSAIPLTPAAEPGAADSQPQTAPTLQ